MAKRKRGKRKGFSLRLEKDYRSEQYVIYIMNAETGLLQAGTIAPELTDGDIYETLENLIVRLEDPEVFAELFPDQSSDDSQKGRADDSDTTTFVEYFITMSLRNAFAQHGPLEAADVIGILEVIKTSVKRWSVGMHRRGYLTYLEGFLGQMGVNVKKLSAEEARALGLEAPPDMIEGDYNEIE